MSFKTLFTTGLVLANSLTFAQKITTLDEVVIVDDKFESYNKSQVIYRISDSILKRQSGSLTDLLNFQTPIYFKENGYGMVSSPSFRGTTAQQTAVLWNGLPVNSFLLGQTDFNSVSFKSFSSIDIKPGGGSVLGGSGAIGGLILLNNDLKFGDFFTNDLQLGYGSFETFNGNYNLKAATAKFSVHLNFNRRSAANDFDQKGKDWKNTNGQFYANSMNAAFGYKLNKANTLSFYSSLFEDERHFSLTSVHQTPTKYQNSNSRNLLIWNYAKDRFESNLRLAHFEELYNFFEDTAQDAHSSGQVKSNFVKYDAALNLTDQISISGLVNYTQSTGEGQGSGIDKDRRNIADFSLVYKHEISTKLGYEFGATYEYADDFKNPFLYNAGIYYQPVSFYTVKLNHTKNYRIPTFNDLYWQPGGNLDLNPETSFQWDLTQEFKVADFKFSASLFHNKMRDMIQWLPTPQGYWRAENTNKVEVMGLELFSNYKLDVQNHHLEVSASYGYTKSQDLDTKYQLTYVPFHKGTLAVNYRYHRAAVFLQTQYTGKVFTTVDNTSKNAIGGYAVLNTGFLYHIDPKQRYSLGIDIKNVTDVHYENMLNRPMPGVHYNLQLYITL